jgi:hypothetical protein
LLEVRDRFGWVAALWGASSGCLDIVKRCTFVDLLDESGPDTLGFKQKLAREIWLF